MIKIAFKKKTINLIKFIANFVIDTERRLNLCFM